MCSKMTRQKDKEQKNMNNWYGNHLQKEGDFFFYKKYLNQLLNCGLILSLLQSNLFLLIDIFSFRNLK